MRQNNQVSHVDTALKRELSLEIKNKDKIFKDYDMDLSFISRAIDITMAVALGTEDALIKKTKASSRTNKK